MAKVNDDVDKENDPSSSSLMGKSLPNLESGTKAESNHSEGVGLQSELKN
ncbi:hypothetical protein TSMEX_008437 [Taenia solium]|eukprot:TsM_000224600 transcript=TsM_000224600 gene=TsM_000224600